MEKVKVQGPLTEYTVSWAVEECAESPEAAALQVAKKHFQDRIALGENGSACLFIVDGTGISLDYVVSNLTPEQLPGVFGHEHPTHSRQEWVNAVRSENTISGYWEWVKHQLTL